MGKGNKPTRPVPSGPPGAVAPCPTCLTLRITDIAGLYKPGADDRPLADQGGGTTQGSGYAPPYTSSDNQGRIFINSVPGSPPILGNATWTKNKQYVDITVLVEPPTIAIPPGSKITWLFFDPDDPTNEGPDVHPEAGVILDPNDYSGSPPVKAKTPVPTDNDPSHAKQEGPKFEQVDAKYALSGGNQTLVDIPSRTSKVRFNVSDIAGDNWTVAASMHAIAPITVVTGTATGIMTAWNRIQVEFVWMTSTKATPLPVDQIQVHYDKACVQVDISKVTEATGANDKPDFGTDDTAADNAIEAYTQAPPTGMFSNAGKKGWFFIAAANRRLPYAHADVLFEGNATANGNKVTLPSGTTLKGTPFVVRVFNSAQIVGVPAPKPDEPVVYVTFLTTTQTGNDLGIAPHDFHLVEDPDNSFLDADLTSYGITPGSTIPIQVLSRGENAVVIRGISPGGVDVPIPGKPGETHHFFGGRLVVFTKSMPGPGGGSGADIRLVCHELCHAFDNAHKCGNWDWKNQAARTSCCMNYWIANVLDDSKPARKPIPWTENRMSPELCAPHLRHIRDYHLEDNPGLGWGKP